MATAIDTKSKTSKGAGNIARKPDARIDDQAQNSPDQEDGTSENRNGQFPALLRFPRLRDTVLTLQAVWAEIVSFWLSVPSPPFDEVGRELIFDWEAFLSAHAPQFGEPEPVASPDWLMPTSPEDPRDFARFGFDCTSVVELFLSQVEDGLRTGEHEPPLRFWQLSAKLALYAAEFQAACFSDTIRERRKAYDSLDAAESKPCHVPDPLAQSWRREDPCTLRRLLDQAEDEAESAGYALPIPAYRLAIGYALAIARREEAFERFYANDQDL